MPQFAFYTLIFFPAPHFQRLKPSIPPEKPAIKHRCRQICTGITQEAMVNLGKPPEETRQCSSLSFIAPMIPEADRLMPSRVDLEHHFLGPDDSTFVTERITVTLLTRHYGYEMRGMAGADIPWQPRVFGRQPASMD